MKRLRVGVIYGGRSGEHEVSLASAAAVIANLDRTRYEPIPVKIDRDGRWAIADRPPSAVSAAEVIEQTRQETARPGRPGREVHLVAHPSDEAILSIDRSPQATGSEDADRALVTGLALDVIFPVLHGPYGEDGTIQGLLELANVPYVGAGVAASAVGMDKAIMKEVFAARHLPITPHLVVLARRWKANPKEISAQIADQLGFPVFVKPANLGSSVGISKVKKPDQLAAAMDLAAEFDRKLVVEAAVPHAREIEVAVLGNDDPEASVAGEILPSREFYDYEAKYLDPDSKLLIPAPLTAEQAAEVTRLALAVFTAVDCAGMARVDFLMSGQDGPVLVNEINTIPGFTTISMYSKLWGATGVAYPALLDRLIALAFERHAEKQQRRTSLT